MTQSAPPDGRRARSDQRRAQILEAAIQIIGTEGIAHLSHREVAERAGASLGLIRYHFATVDNLTVAAFNVLELRRQLMAQHALRSAVLEMDANQQAELLFQTYYGPNTSRESLIGVLSWLVAAGRSPVLAAVLKQQRPRIDADLSTLLAALGVARNRVSILRNVMDGAVVSGTAEAVADVEAYVLRATADALANLGTS